MASKNAVSPWYLYLIETARGALYTGITLDIERRFSEHKNQSKKTAKALRGKGPLNLVYCAILTSQSEALRAEIWVKKQSKTKKLALVANNAILPFEHSLHTHEDIGEQ